MGMHEMREDMTKEPRASSRGKAPAIRLIVCTAVFLLATFAALYAGSRTAGIRDRGAEPAAARVAGHGDGHGEGRPGGAYSPAAPGGENHSLTTSCGFLPDAFMTTLSGVKGIACLLFIFTLGLAFRSKAMRTDVARHRNELADLNVRLDEERELVRLTLECMAEGVIVTDTEGRVFLMNSRAGEITGYPEDRAAGTHILEVMNPVSLSSGRADILGKIYRSGGDADISREDIVILGRDHAPCTISCRCSPLRNGNGEIRGVVLTFIDAAQER